MKHKRSLRTIGFIFLYALLLQSSPVFCQRQADYATKLDPNRSIAPYFTSATTKKMTPDADGFIQRWLLRTN